MGKYIPFRLRDGKDDDIDKNIEDELKRAASQRLELDRSDIMRLALRFYFRYRNNPSGVFNGTGVPPTPSIYPEIPVQGNEWQTDPQRATFRATGKPFLNTGNKEKR